MWGLWIGNTVQSFGMHVLVEWAFMCSQKEEVLQKEIDINHDVLLSALSP